MSYSSSLLQRGTHALRHIDWLSFLLPPCCALCREPLTNTATLCGLCWLEIDFATPPFCHSCGLPFEFNLGNQCLQCQKQSPPWTNFSAAVRYNDQSARMITQFKHNQRFTLLPLLAKWLLFASKRLPEPDYIIPMPIHRWRMFSRQFNQAALLSERLAHLRDTPELYAPLILQRLGRNDLQRGLSPAERKQNVAGVFHLHPKAPNLTGRHVWLVDDVATTGASLSSASKVLIHAGAEVSTLVVARVNGAFSNMS